MENVGSNRSFGIIFFVVFLLIGLWPLLDDNALRIWSLILSIIFLILGLLKSKLLTPLNKIWIKLGELLGRLVAPIVMGIVFFLVVTPIGFIMRIAGKDFLGKKFDKKKISYWIKREKPIDTMKRQL